MLLLLQPIWARQLLAALAHLTVERLPQQAEAWPDIFDNTAGIGPVERPLFYRHKRSGILLPYKGLPAPVPIEEKIGIEAHITAIAFGTTRSARKFWRKQIAAGLIPVPVLRLYTGVDTEGPSLAPDVLERAAERMALHQRFWKVPYHYVSLLNGDVLYNNPISRQTFHGNGGNRRLVGVSLEGKYPGLERWEPAKRPKKYNEYDVHTIETGRAGLTLAVNNSREEGAPIEALYAHRQYSGGRLGDPGAGWWKEIGIPVSEELHLERRVTFKHASGNQVCREWDPLGLVDYRGRPL